MFRGVGNDTAGSSSEATVEAEAQSSSQQSESSSKQSKQKEKPKGKEKSGKGKDKGRRKTRGKDFEDLKSKLPPDLKAFDFSDFQDMDALKAKLDEMKSNKEGELHVLSCMSDAHLLRPTHKL